VYTANDVNPAPGTELELSGIDGITWTVQPDPEGYPKDDSKFAKAPESFEVKTSDGEPHGLPYDLQNSAPCFMKNEYYYLSPGGFGHSPDNHNDGGHLYVYAGGIAPEPGTKVVLSQFPEKVFVVEELPEEEGAKDMKFKEGAGAGSFSIKTADGQPHKIDKKLLNEGNMNKDRDQSMKGTWKCLGAVAGEPDKPIGTFKCMGATPEITVHGDPIFKFGEKHNATRLWLPSDKLTPLLKWNSEGGRPMQLLGKTFHPKGGKGDVSKNNEWFDQLVIKHGLATVLDVSTNVDEPGTMKVTLDDKVVKPEKGKDTYISAEHHKISFQASKRANTNADQLHIEAADLALSIYISKASKFNKEKDQVKYAHLNMKFDNGLPTDGSGIFAELAGMEPMSPATAKLLERPADSA